MDEVTSQRRKSKPNLRFSLPLFGLTMFLLGVFAIVAIRFATYKSDDVHYHANFALYINGQKDEFKSFTFYEEVATCDVQGSSNAKVRAHMHDNNSGLIHVHDAGVTWGHFFANLGYTLGEKVIVTDDGAFVDDEKGIAFMLNGDLVKNVANRVIKSEDKLAIIYGDTGGKKFKELYDSVSSDSRTANTTKDPSACSGSHDATFLTRLKQALGFQSSP